MGTEFSLAVIHLSKPYPRSLSLLFVGLIRQM